MNRNQIIATICVLAAFTALILADYNNLTRPQPTDDQTNITRKWQTVQLGYCDSQTLKPCIVSFSRAENGMLVNLLIPSYYPEFYLLVERGAEELRYECKQNEDLPTNAHCIGREIPPGEDLQFTLASLEGNYILAEGRFTIIGLMLATPEQENTLTPTPTETIQPTETAFIIEILTASPTALSLDIFTSPAITPTPTATLSSYPNPSYPNP